MTGFELKAALKSLGWSQYRLSQKIDVAASSVGRWIADRDAKIPGPVSAFVRLALKVKELTVVLDE